MIERVGASAPGKMLVGGEYAVLRGAPAIVTAVQLRAQARWVDAHTDQSARGLDDPSPRFPEAAAARRIAEDTLGVSVPGELELDVSKLRGETIKLGVGSSAAAAAAAAGAVYASAGHDLEDADVVAKVMDAALRGHMDVAPRGSGVDVAASVYGGTSRYVRSPLSVTSVEWPKGLRTAVVWTAKAASTREFLDRLAAFEARDGDRHDALMTRVDQGAAAFADAFAHSASEVIAATHAVFVVLRDLSEASGAPIIEDTLSTIEEHARAAGGASKPSGAGGGDVALAFFTSDEDLARFAKAVPFEILDVSLGGPGVRAEAS